MFTFISILLAFLMFGMLDALRTRLSQAVNLAGADRLHAPEQGEHHRVESRASHYEKVRAVQGVRAVAPFNWFGGVYKDGKQQIQVQADGSRRIHRRCIPRCKLKPEELAAWKHDRQGIVIGQVLADPYGWKVGQRIPLRSAIWRKSDGTRHLGVQHRRHLHRRRQRLGQAQRDVPVRLLQRVVAVRQGPRGLDGDQGRRSRRIRQGRERASTRMFANSSNETKTATERVFIKQFLDQMGNIGLILVSVTSAVFFTMLLVTANTMAQSVRERTNEIGVLKTLGFSGESMLSLVLLESLFLTFTGGLVGLGLAWFFAKGLGAAMKEYFPVFEIGASTILVGARADAGCSGCVTGLWPRSRPCGLKIVDALRRI